MSDEATSLLSHEPTLCEQIYRTVQTLHDIEVALHAHVTAGVPQFALVAITLQFVVEGNSAQLGADADTKYTVLP